jgi:[acyl-carrier-protein] S-malonyltransferase
MRIGLIFPGQGSQYVGMGKAFYDQFSCARHVFNEADEALGRRLSKIVFDGAESDLTLTHNAQPAILTLSMAMMSVVLQECGDLISHGVDRMAGHSLGEYTALVASGIIPFDIAVKAVEKRGHWMQKAVPVGEGAMAAVLGLTVDVLEQLLVDDGCFIANDNSPGQIVISGLTASIHATCESLVQRGAKRCVLLPVSATFHCPLMEPAALLMKDILDEIPLSPGAVPVWSNVTAQPMDANAIPTLLKEQITERVRWREIITHWAEEEVSRTIEIGPGRVLTGLNTRSAPAISAKAFHSVDDLTSLFP